MDTKSFASALGIDWHPLMDRAIPAPKKSEFVSVEFKKGTNHPSYGTKHSGKTKELIRQSATGRKVKLCARTKKKKALVAYSNRMNWINKNLPQIDKVEAQLLYDSGMTYKKLAAHYGVSTGRIQNLKLKTDLSRQKVGRNGLGV
jgi:hypothetical protein